MIKFKLVWNSTVQFHFHSLQIKTGITFAFKPSNIYKSIRNKRGVFANSLSCQQKLFEYAIPRVLLLYHFGVTYENLIENSLRSYAMT